MSTRMEYWDIYTADRKKTGRIMRRDDWHMAPDEFHVSVLGVVQTPDGRCLITRRKEDKPWAAGWWEFPGGGVNAGEEPHEAAIREVGEETGLDVSHAPGELAYTYTRINPDEQNNYFMDIYRFTLDFDESDVTVQESEVSGFKLATIDEIQEIARQGIFLHYNSIRSIFED